MNTMARKKRGKPPSKPKTPLAKKLIRLREQLDLTQEEAAAQLGVSPRTWISWENGLRKPSATATSLLKITFPDFS